MASWHNSFRPSAPWKQCVPSSVQLWHVLNAQSTQSSQPQHHITLPLSPCSTPQLWPNKNPLDPSTCNWKTKTAVPHRYHNNLHQPTDATPWPPPPPALFPKPAQKLKSPTQIKKVLAKSFVIHSCPGILQTKDTFWLPWFGFNRPHICHPLNQCGSTLLI